MNLIFPGQGQPQPQPVFQRPQTEQQPVILGERNPFDISPVKASVEVYTLQLDGFAESATALDVIDSASQDTAVEMAGQVKKLGKSLDDARKIFVAAPNEYVKQVNGLAKGIMDKLVAIESVLKRKISNYQAEVERKRLQAEAEARKAAIEAQRLIDEEARLAREAADKAAAEAARVAEEAAKAGDADAARLAEVAAAEQAKAQVQAELPIAQVEAPFIPQSTGPVRTADGTASVKRVWKFEVKDVASIPREYLLVNESAIRKAVAAGIRVIPGVEIFEDTQIAIRA